MVFASSRKNQIFFWLFGFILTFNWLVIPISKNSPRFTDVFSLAVFLVLLFKLSKSGFTRLGLVMVPLSIAILGFVVKGVLVADMSLIIFGSRLFISVAAGAWLAQKVVEQQCTLSFMYGVSWGAMFVAIIAFGQGTETVAAFNVFIPPGTETWWGNGQLRAVGIWQHPNALGQVQSIGAACAISLALAGPKVRYVPFFLFFGILGATYIGNETRSMILGAGIATVVSLAVSPNRTYKVIAAVIFVYAVLLSPFFLKVVLGDRWFGSNNDPSISSNMAERLQTVLFSIELVLKEPLGYGVEGARKVLKKAFGFSASHNSFISMALTIGVFPLIGLITLLSKRLHYIIRTNNLRYEAAPLLVILLLFFFEDSIFLPSTLLALSIFTFWGATIMLEKKPD